MPDGVVWIAVGLAAMAAVGMVWCCLYTGKEMPEERPVREPRRPMHEEMDLRLEKRSVYGKEYTGRPE